LRSATGATNLGAPSADGDSLNQRSINMTKLGKVSVATQAAKSSPFTETTMVPQFFI
jgi:hypothetical protein